ncbi:probable WRKY transcription factor 3 [Solanum dulcamara]|uniref:probable WRKY transcription factor 3 n=1 Tax=Solanum dulcamara TaxID=45834 RepID=UPI0024854A31|nr:probable WRKY transcription factor 3 [Solanum dulcamara]
MGDNNWDISGVIRNYNISGTNNVVAPNFGSETFENDNWNTFDRLLTADMTNFDGLSEIFSIDFSVAHKKKSDNQVIIMDQNNNQELYLHPIQPTQFSQQIFLPPSPTTITCVPTTTTTSQELTDLQQQLVMQDKGYPNFTLPMETPLIESCKRKNQPIRVIYEVLQEELTDDKWKWRKYGEKPIKGFSFPRNYYKCSTSKLCEAKKIIEKSPKNGNYFLVSYSGEHNHDPPTNRKSLAFCNCSSKHKLPKGINIVPKALNLNASSSSSKRAKHSRVEASSISLPKSTLDIESNNKMVVVAVENNNNGEKEENVNKNILMKFEELQGVTASTLWG